MFCRKELQITGALGVLDAGCILYSFHFGVWELMPLALSRLGYRIGILVNRYHTGKASIPNRLLDALLKRWRSVSGVKVFYKENVLEIARFLRSGGIFGMLVDGNTFFQKYAKAEKLAAVCRVPAVSFAAYRKKGQGFLDIGCDIRALVRTMPLDYVWFYKSR